jgi:hypothetical protein
MSLTLRFAAAVGVGAVTTAGAVHGSVPLLVAGIVMTVALLGSIGLRVTNSSGRSMAGTTGTERVFLSIAGLFVGLFVGGGTRPDTLPVAAIGVVLALVGVWALVGPRSTASRGGMVR